jgi:hypothetical protein
VANTSGRKKSSRKTRLYDANGQPVGGINELVHGWLDGSIDVQEHKPPAQFAQLREAYDEALASLEQGGLTRKAAHIKLLSELTELIQGQDLSAPLAERLSAAPINESGFRTALSQGFAKNAGENFINIIVYALADILKDQDDILVDKGTPVPLRSLLSLSRTVRISPRKTRDISIPIESDLAIWRRSRPTEAVIISAKTRLKEIFHVGTMWKLFFDMLNDEYCLDKWELTAAARPKARKMLYVFATADNIPLGGKSTQGPDVERAEVRNLIAMDASFFDYVFVSKSGIEHVSNKLRLSRRREALFHELGTLVSLVDQKFGL